MSHERLNAVLETLRAEEEGILTQLDAAKARVTELEKDHERIHGAIASLTGEGGKKKKSSTKRTKPSPTGKPAPTKADVVEAITLLLRETPVIKNEELLKAVGTVMDKNGRSRMGLSLRFKEALQDARFLESSEGVQLAKAREAR